MKIQIAGLLIAVPILASSAGTQEITGSIFNDAYRSVLRPSRLPVVHTIQQNSRFLHCGLLQPSKPAIAMQPPSMNHASGPLFVPRMDGKDGITKNHEKVRMESWNLALRGLLELSGLAAMGYWGFEKGDGAGRYALMIGVPLVSAAAWGIFAVEGDPSRSGTTVVHTPGIVRLALEVGFFTFSTWAIQDIGSKPLAVGFGGAAVFHYAVSYKRVLWLLHL